MKMRNMQDLQRGISLSGLFIGLFIIIVLALLGMRLIPPYMEYATAKNAIQAISRDRVGASPQDIRRAFDARASVDDITAIKAADLDITKEGGELVISFAYRKEVPLFANVGVYMDFAASSNNP